ncbi:MAG: hypothetical protein WAN13_03690 [Candidatus Acidiferrales bacterium]|jgi:hypothetical protein
MDTSLAPARKSRPSRLFHLVALAMIAAGFAGGYKTLVAAINTMESGVTHAIFPGSVVIPFSAPGDYEIYYENPSEFGGRVFESGRGMPGLQFRVTNSETGEVIALHRPVMNETYTINGRSGRAVLQFHIAEPGGYTVSARYDDSEQHNEAVFAVGNVHIGRFILLIFACIACALGLGGGGLLLVVLIETWRYSSKKKLQSAAATSAAVAAPPLL